MTHKISMTKRFPLLMFLLACSTVGFPVFNQSVLAQSELTEERLTVVLKDFSILPNATEAQAGKLTFVAVNEGMSTHELVILRTDLNPAALPRKEAKSQQGIATEYLVNEDDTRIQPIDEIEEFPAGTSQKKTVALEPGNYVLFCNIPGHYDKGMYASLHITPK